MPTLNLGSVQGPTGKSAYQSAVDTGFVGTEAEWIASLQGTDGVIGSDGESAYEVAVSEGFAGTVEDWLESLKGADGTSFSVDATGLLAGRSAYDNVPPPFSYFAEDTSMLYFRQPAAGEWSAGTPFGRGEKGDKGDQGDPGLPGSDGENGTPGEKGDPGDDGAPGLSAYQIALAQGFVGTVEEWLASLVGPAGQDGNDGANGADGSDGNDGAAGLSAYQVAVSNGFGGTQVEWLASLQGADGEKGDKGDPGDPGPAGADGADGAPGADAPAGIPVTETKTTLVDADGVFVFDSEDGGAPKLSTRGAILAPVMVILDGLDEALEALL